MESIKVTLVVGARPNFIKAFPVYKALQKSSRYSLKLINTGQHYNKNMSDIFFDQLNMKKPDVNLGIGSATHGEQTGKILIESEKIFLEEKPDIVLVFGDVNSTVAVALAAIKLNIMVSHIEAGLRSFDRTMPEEINRILTDQISEILFTTSEEAKENLLREGKNSSQIHMVGNTMIASLVQFESRFDGKQIKEQFRLEDSNYILITLHRPSNVDDPQTLSVLIETLNKIAEIKPCVWPVHPRTRLTIDNIPCKMNDNLIISDPLGYLDFMGLQREAALVITDSGGVQEESTYFGVPCLTVRKNTERPVTITKGTNKLIGTDYTNIQNHVLSILSNKTTYYQKPPLWDGNASQRLVKVLDDIL